MINDFDARAIEKEARESVNVNITQPNVMKELFSVLFGIVAVVLFIYLSVYFVSGIIVNNLSFEKQVALEDFFSGGTKDLKLVSLPEAEQQRLERVRDRIIAADKDFPKGVKRKIGVIQYNAKNAFCVPNGNIYITSSLYKLLETDEELTFIIAHELGHYKHRDHLMRLRRGVSNGAVMILLSFMEMDSAKVQDFISDSFNLADLKFSRGEEEKADKYAVAALKTLYGNTDAGPKVMKILGGNNHFGAEFLYTHPDTERRIKYIREYSDAIP